jgi:hypothetical protein
VMGSILLRAAWHSCGAAERPVVRKMRNQFLNER